MTLYKRQRGIITKRSRLPHATYEQTSKLVDTGVERIVVMRDKSFGNLFVTHGTCDFGAVYTRYVTSLCFGASGTKKDIYGVSALKAMGYVLVLAHTKILAVFRCSRIPRFSLCFGALARQVLLSLVFGEPLFLTLL